MDRNLEAYFKDMAIDKLMNSPAGDKIKYAIQTFEKIQTHIYTLLDKEGEEGITTVKSVTVMTFSLLQKFVAGKKLSDLTNDDWKEIASEVSEYVVLMENEAYTKFVFNKYEQYIRFCVEQIKEYESEVTVVAIQSLADELAKQTMLFDENQINEVTYIEECLWICLEAMIKLIASTASRIAPEEIAEFSQALAAYAFEYGRYILYSREQTILKEYMEAQYELDKQLKNKYEDYIKDLEKQTEQFYVLILLQILEKLS